MGGLNLTGFYMVDFKNLNTMTLLSEIFPENNQNKITVIQSNNLFYTHSCFDYSNRKKKESENVTRFPDQEI